MTELSVTRFRCCIWCGVTYPLSPEYFHSKGYKDHLRSYCKVCARAKNKTWRKNNYDKCKATRTQWNERNREEISRKAKERYYNNHEKRKASNRKWHEANREKSRQAAKRHYEENRDQYLKNFRKWREENPHYYRLWSAQNREKLNGYYESRRAQIKATNTGTVTPEVIEQMIEDQDFLCAYCEVPLKDKYHMDHIVPVKHGGTHDWENIAITCISCNVRKNTRSLEFFMMNVLQV